MPTLPVSQHYFPVGNGLPGMFSVLRVIVSDNFYIDMGRRIATLRKAAGLTQEGMAEFTEIGASYIARIETGTRRPSLDVLSEIAHALDVPLWKLIVDQRLSTDEKVWKSASNQLAEASRDLPAKDIKLLVALAKRLQE